ncbi:MAG: FAD-dependent oxidoreductase [Pedobacter sp.]|nr:MAG: FAD-dependent oxidoreductase [Pedobacter sp.]
MKSILSIYDLLPIVLLVVQTLIIVIGTVYVLRYLKILQTPYAGMEIRKVVLAASMLLSTLIISFADVEALSASYIIYCDGIAGAENPYFNNLPFAPNKGEAVLVEINDLPTNHIYKKGFSLVPWKDNIFWLGSNYLWEFENDSPTPGYYRFAENWLRQNLKVPFTIIDHLAGIRPATLERRPFVGFHPLHPRVGIFNGMGAKGCSLAPFFANQFVNSIKTGTPIYKESDVKRFTRVLSRT